ncbi:S-adenosyl-L-methionine-dependent methyltransferase [Fomitiporia mediterranea MF3/22]|uniref:S-adenosyl-L-methionine-dependent methyltransferase n=1 Tax=Fomitiporia mediterranea (strain MF3/22) TaxID=694068 RepID=UPI000440767B|nr:S-adenosyl-L-methionine-dependent methyltransferase [Fomitiporia mediterranea MF3/22]EJD05343.1 S-adenosyl-L-methionine-dependent methyltransferase [Fomitiporia mediterranea MF3/22]
MSVTVTGIQLQQGLKDLFGRGMNSESYKLPADKQEMDRLSLQHRIWTLMADGLYPKDAELAVQSVLHRPREDQSTPMILDIGSGSGTWAVEMALKFPHARVIGMDLIQSSPNFVPENCVFIKADATNTLSEYVGHFDIVQCRSVAKHVPDAVAFTRSLGRTLRPGGIFFFSDAVTDVFNEKLETYPLAPIDGAVDSNGVSTNDYSWFARWMSEVTDRWTTKERQYTDGDKLHILLREDGQFEDINVKEYFSPIGWDGGSAVESSNGAEIGRLMVLNVCDFLQASRPSLLSSGLSEEAVERWARNVRQEAANPAKHMLFKWVINWATKSSTGSQRKPAKSVL